MVSSRQTGHDINARSKKASNQFVVVREAVHGFVLLVYALSLFRSASYGLSDRSSSLTRCNALSALCRLRSLHHQRSLQWPGLPRRTRSSTSARAWCSWPWLQWCQLRLSARAQAMTSKHPTKFPSINTAASCSGMLSVTAERGSCVSCGFTGPCRGFTRCLASTSGLAAQYPLLAHRHSAPLCGQVECKDGKLPVQECAAAMGFGGLLAGEDLE